MDPIMKAWMFHSWAEDYNDEQKMLENQSYLIGSFINPELVKRLLGKDGETHTSSDEEFEETSRRIFEDSRKQEESKPRRRRKRKIEG